MIEVVLGQRAEIDFYRVITPAYTDKPLSGMGAARRGGRFNRPGQEALYLSKDATTALAEYKQDNPWLPPGMICTFLIKELRVADFSRGYEVQKWPALWADFTAMNRLLGIWLTMLLLPDWMVFCFHPKPNPVVSI